MTKEVAENLCDIIGEVSRNTGATTKEGRSFIRVRVTINVSMPLCHGKVISLEDGDKSRVVLKFKRLPNLCYWCCRLTHDDKDCDLWIQSKGSLTTEQQQFGPNLRASPYLSSNKKVIYVVGFYLNKPTCWREKESKVVAAPPTVAKGAENLPLEVPPTNMETEKSREAVNLVPFSNSNKSMVDSNDHTIPGTFPSLAKAVPQSSPFDISGSNNNGDLFLSELTKIDQDIQKFDSPLSVIEDECQATDPASIVIPQETPLINVVP